MKLNTLTGSTNLLTVSLSFVMKSAKCVGTKPGATQFTRVLGAISTARAYREDWKRQAPGDVRAVYKVVEEI